MQQAKLILTLAIVLAAVAVLSCSPKTLQFETDMRGSNEVPPVTTNAAGSVSFTLNADKTAMTFELEITSPIDSAVASHIHLGAAGANRSIVVTLWSGQQGMGYTGRLATGTITQPDIVGPLAGMTLSALADSMDRGVLYVNVHTTAHPAGEIRGQLRVKP